MLLSSGMELNMMNNSNLAMFKYSKRRQKFAVQGLWLALISGITAGIYGNLTPIISEDPTLAFGTTIGVVMAMSFVTQGLYDFIAGIWMLIYNFGTGRSIKEYFRLARSGRMAGLLLLAAVFGGPVALGASMIGVNLCGVTPALIVSSLSPVISAIMGRIMYKERLGMRVVIGITIAIIGIIIVGWSKPEGDYPYFMFGLLISFIAAIGWGLEGAVATYAADMTDPNTAVGLFRTLLSGVVGIVIMIPIFGICTREGLIGWDMVSSVLTSPKLLVVVIIAGLMCAISYCTTYVAFSKTGGTRSLVLINTYAIWSIVVGLMMAAFGISNYSVSGIVVIGAIVDFIGIALVIGNPKDLVKLRTV